MWLYVPSACAPELEPSTSESPGSPTYEPWLTLSGKPSQRPFSWRGWRTRPWIRLLSGTTWSPSTAQRGVDAWILVVAGFPCQPASAAGRRAGTDDERWLWPDIARVIGAVEPRLVFLENVPGLLSVNGGTAFHEVVEDLSALGFDADWDCFSASEVGAPHRRERLFILAYRRGLGRDGWPGVERGGRDAALGDEAVDHARDRSGPVADAGRECDQRRGDTRILSRAPAAGVGEAPQWQRYGHAAGDGGADVADASDRQLPIRGRGSKGRDGPRPAGSELADADGRDGPSLARPDLGDLPPGRGEGDRELADADLGGRGVDRSQAVDDQLGLDDPERRSAAVAHAGGADNELAEGLGRNRSAATGSGPRDQPDGSGAPVGDAVRADVAIGGSRPIARPRAAPFPPSPSDRDAWAWILASRPDLAPAVESGIRGVADGVARGVVDSRADRLHLIGNGVVPHCAAVAFRALATRAGLAGLLKR